LYLRPRLLVSSWPPATTELTTRPNPATITKRRNRERRTMAFIVSGLDLYMKRRPRPAHVSRTLRSILGAITPKKSLPVLPIISPRRRTIKKDRSKGALRGTPRPPKKSTAPIEKHAFLRFHFISLKTNMFQQNSLLLPNGTKKLRRFSFLAFFKTKDLQPHRAPRIAPHMFISSASNHPIHVCECNSLRFQRSPS
jgi:hypothetical protein